MKKKMALLLISAMIISSLTACGQKENPNVENTTPETNIETTNTIETLETTIAPEEETPQYDDPRIAYKDENFVLFKDGSNNFADEIDGYNRCLSMNVPEKYQNFKSIANQDIKFYQYDISKVNGKYSSLYELNNFQNNIIQMEIEIENYHFRTLAFLNNLPYFFEKQTTCYPYYEYNEETSKRNMVETFNTDYTDFDGSGVFSEVVGLLDFNKEAEQTLVENLFSNNEINDFMELLHNLNLNINIDENSEHQFGEDDNFYYVKFKKAYFTYDNDDDEEKRYAFSMFAYDKKYHTLVYFINIIPIETYNSYVETYKDTEILSFNQAMDEFIDVTRLYRLD